MLEWKYKKEMKKMLYPKMTSSRMVFDLSGVWEFKLLDEEGTEREAAGNSGKQAAGQYTDASSVFI